MDDPPIYTQWEATLDDLLDRTEKFPKSIRFTFTTRIDNLALDIMEHLVEARYHPNRGEKARLLAESDRALTRLRVLLRLPRRSPRLKASGWSIPPISALRMLDDTLHRLRSAP